MKKSLITTALSFSLIAPLAAQAADDSNDINDSHYVVSNKKEGAAQSKTTPIFYGTGGDFPFSSAVRVGNTLYLSGQLGMKEGKLVNGGVKAETEQALDNINNILLKYGYQKSDLVKCMAMLTDMNDFNEFNEGYKAKLSAPYPARSAFEVSGLALGAQVEIECMAVK